MKLIKLLGISLISLCFVGCGNKSDEKTLVMGCSADYPPFEFRKHGEIMGLDIDISRHIAKELGYELEIKEMEFAGLVASLNANAVDFVASAMNISPEREKQVDFTKIYFRASFGLLFNKDAPVSDFSEMKGKHLGVQLGTTMEKFLNSKKDELDLKISTLYKNPDLVQELKVGRIDAVLVEEAQVKEFAKANPTIDYILVESDLEDGYAIAFPKGSELRDKFNKVLDEMEKSGKLDEIKNKWIK